MASPRSKLTSTSFLKHFGALKDPRKVALCDHLLTDMLVIAILATICGADGWTEFVAFGIDKEPFLRTILSLPSGIPTASCFQKLFARLQPKHVDAAFRGWINDLVATSDGRLSAPERPAVAVDGKTLRHSGGGYTGERPLHMVHAWMVRNRLLLGQFATDAKSNEITAIPELCKMLDLTGAIVTIDAAGCQKAITETVVEAGADYVIAVKANQPTLFKAAKEVLDAAKRSAPSASHSTSVETHNAHGRHEERRVWAADARALPIAQTWRGLASFILVESTCTRQGKVARECRYYISSCPHDDAKSLGSVVRGHWGVENNLHWSLDVAFREDASGIYADHGPHNVSTLRKIALTALTRSSGKGSIATRRKRAGWNDEYLLEVLTAATIG